MRLKRCGRRKSGSIFRHQHLAGKTKGNNEEPQLGNPFSRMTFRYGYKVEMINAMLFPMLRKIFCLEMKCLKFWTLFTGNNEPGYLHKSLVFFKKKPRTI
jgi:hypothetical protein